jgi:ABC-type sugar transport system substrate-binding protein
MLSDRRRIVLSAAAVMTFPSAMGQALAQRRPKIGISMPESQNSFFNALGKSLVDNLRAAGADPVLLAANGDANEQINNINDLVAQQIDALIVNPLNTEGPAPGVKRAFDAGIPIFMVARTLDAKYANWWKTFIGIDFVHIGTAKGKWVVENTKPGKVGMLLATSGAVSMMEQERSFRAVVEPAGYKVVFAQNSPQTRERGLKLTEDALVANPDIMVMYAGSDDLGLGASQAVKAAGREGKVSILGLNGTPPALAAVHNGEMAMTVLLDAATWGKTVTGTVMDFLRAKKEPPRFIPLDFVIVTQKNAYEHIPPALRERLGVKPR